MTVGVVDEDVVRLAFDVRLVVELARLKEGLADASGVDNELAMVEDEAYCVVLLAYEDAGSC